MIRLQRLTGMRPIEVVKMRLCDIDMSEQAIEGVWLYELADHKNRWRGHRRLVPIGPKAKEILTPFLDRPADAYLFSPKDVHHWRVENRPAQTKKKRKTPIYPCELRQREKKKEERRRKGNSRLRDHYDTDSYRRAITYGLKKARKAGVEVDHWHPNQLRHNRGTEVRRKYGLEAAQVSLGHARADVTQVYAEKNLKLAMEIAKESG